MQAVKGTGQIFSEASVWLSFFEDFLQSIAEQDDSSTSRGQLLIAGLWHTLPARTCTAADC